MRAGSPKSAAIYARISHDPSGERLGVQRQEADCLEESKRRGWSVAQIYVDDDLSAFDTKKPRPEYQRLLSDIQLGQRDGVMIWRLDRLHRQPRELEEFIVLCDKHQVALATVTGDVDLATSQGRLLARAWGAFAAHECDVRSERQKRANLERARRGLLSGQRRPYGYKDDCRTVIAAEATVIKEAAARVLRGESLRSVCADFNRRRIPTARRTLWQGQCLSKMLANPRLAGWSTYYGDVVGKGTWKAILTRGRSDRLRATLADPARLSRDGPKRCRLLTGVLRCGRCGGRMAGARDQRKTPRYECTKRPDRKSCGRVSIHTGDLDASFLDQAFERLDSDALPATLERGQLNDAKWRKAKSELDAAEGRLRSMARDYAAEFLTRQEWQSARPVLLARVNAARAALRQDRVENVVSEFVGDSEQLRRTWDDLPPSRQRAIVTALVEEVVIWPAPNTRPQCGNRMLIWWRGEPRPATPRGARKGIPERRAAGQFDRCSVTGCAEPYLASGFCNVHLLRVKVHGDPGTAERKRVAAYRGATCSEGGCEQVATSVARCAHHYKEWIRTNPERPRCPAPSCDRSAQVGKWCGMHYQRLKRTGTTAGFRPRLQTAS
jgi:site-specific DNA recombinase